MSSKYLVLEMDTKLPNLLHLLFLILISSRLVSAQQVPFPESYDQTKISRWGHTNKGTNWDTSPYLPFIYNGVAMRIMPPNGVSYDVDTDAWDFGSGEKYPLIVFFHGAGEVGTDNNNQLKHGGRTHRDAVTSGEFPGFLLYPQNAYIDDMKMLIDQMVAEGYPIDLTRIYAHGLSRGAKWSWDFALAYPEITAAIFPMSGMVGEDFTDLIYTPVRISQGGKDSNPAPGWTFDRLEYFEEIGGDAELFYLENYGHGTWNSMYALDDFFTWFLDQSVTKIYAKFGYSEVCPTDPIDVTLGVNPGLDGYRWRLGENEIVGETSHELHVTAYGDYFVSVLINGEWTDWSEPKTVEQREPTATPPISTSGVQTRILPDPNGRMEVPLFLPAGYETYEWFKDGVSYSSNDVVNAGPGTYTALVQEKFSCSSFLSDEFVIVENTFTNLPDVPDNVDVDAVSKTELSVSWIDNSSTETGFEIWRRQSIEDDFELVSVLDANSTTFSDVDLLAGTVYFYSIRAINENGASELSPEAAKSTLDDFIIPTSPSNLVSTKTSVNYVELAWDEATDDVGIEKYFVYQDGVKILSVNTPGTVSTTV